MGAMSVLSEQNAVVTGTIDFPPGDRPTGVFTVTVLVEDVSRADAPSTIVSSASFESPAATETEVVELPFAVTVPAPMITGIRRLNVRVHVREGAHESRHGASLNGASPNVARPNITEGDFVSTQSHPVTFDSVSSDPGMPASVSVRVPVVRV